MSARDRLLKELLEAHHLQGIEAILSWDQETYMPPGAGAARAEQVAYITGLAHEKQVGEGIRSALEEMIDLETGELRIMTLNDRETRQLKEIWRDYKQQAALPGEFVRELAKHASVSQQAWVKARKENDFEFFEPFLSKMVRMQKEKAAYLGTGDTPYDALLDQFEPNMSSQKVAVLFDEIKQRLVPLIRSITEVKHRVNPSVLTKEYDLEGQWDFGMLMLQAIGFDSNIGRQDRSAHPFTTSSHPTDVRTTTRLQENDIKSALLSTLHEGGHALYEQGLSVSEYGNPLGESISLGIHESQSRMWENLVGLSQPFWHFAYPKLQAKFPEQLRNTNRDQFYAAINRVRPSLIRVEADEATYNLHIMLRFEIEKMIINDDYPVRDLPLLWNDKMEEYLGIRPDTDAEGVLQDVHWSFGAFGYFPTYTLGNLYSVQFFNQAHADMSGLDESFARGDFSGLLAWLRTNIHSKGRSRKAEELVEELTGQPLSAAPFMDYLEQKYKKIYSIS